MGGFKRTLTVGFGMTQVVCDLTSTAVTNSATSLVQLCTGGGTHDPRKPAWDPQCPICNTVPRASLVRGEEVAKDQFVVFSADEIAAVRSEDADAYKGQLLLTAHHAAQVEGKTLPSGTSYLLTPSTGKKAPGDQRAFYAMLCAAVTEMAGEVTFLGRYTVTSKASLYRVRPYQGVLIAEQMLPTDEVAEMPVLDLPEVPESMLDTIRQTARMFIVDFDPATYRNTYAERLAAAVAQRDAQDGSGAALPLTPTVAATNADPFAAMQAQMQAFLTTQPAAAAPAPAKKAAAKKPAKKAAPAKAPAA